jgi:dinuclear metal center YbgI/SA1388 family protein
MNVRTICNIIEEVAPLSLQESYDNAGLLVGNSQMEVSGILICIDITLEIINEAIQKKYNLIISHHPLIFKGLTRIIGQNEIECCVIAAIKNDVAIYAAHTNLDNVLNGVNGKIADKIGLINQRILLPKQGSLLKLVTFVPKLHTYSVREALFNAGAGKLGNYESCSFNSDGIGTFKPNEQALPFVGDINQFHSEAETRIEVILPSFLKDKVLRALLKVHPYEETAYDFVPINNAWKEIGAGIIGELSIEEDEIDFLKRIKEIFNLPTIKHTQLLGHKIKRVALCGGSGSSLLKTALTEKADIYLSGDFKYHDFFEAEKSIIIADIGHYESEQFTKEIFFEIITKKMTTFAVQISGINTNPINYL